MSFWRALIATYGPLRVFVVGVVPILVLLVVVGIVVAGQGGGGGDPTTMYSSTPSTSSPTATETDSATATDTATATSELNTENCPNSREVTDGSGALVVCVPSEWSDVESGTWEEDDFSGFEGQELGPYLRASPDIDSAVGSWDAPSLFFAASSVLADEYYEDDAADERAVAEEIIRDGPFYFDEDCDHDEEGPYNYDDGTYVGAEDIWGNCAGNPDATVHNIVAFVPDDHSFVVFVQFKSTSDADTAAFTTIYKSFDVVGDL